MNSRVLIIDDSPAVHRLVEVWLRPLNVEYHVALGAQDGLRLARTLRPDLILLDLFLQDGRGIELCTQVKADPAISTTPVIILSAESRVEEKVKAFEIGAVDYVIKPFHPAEFQARVRSALRTKYLIDLLADRARVDGLTGLHNRAFFDERLESEISYARRYDTRLSCIMMDIDHFKMVNDTYGHAIGDEVLRHVASTLMRRCRREDIVCRYGGEEFAILTPKVGLDGAITLADDIRQIIGSLQLHSGAQTLSVTCSFGVSEFADLLLPLSQRADEALYFAKNNGRNRVCSEERFRSSARNLSVAS
jgi:diguanylate cyclase (GGDEF)-like protein